MSGPRAPPAAVRATYRLQFHRAFTFRDAQALIPYFAKLGISHLYASPIMEARPGSSHGYDIIDHNRINPEIGGEAGFETLVAALHAHGMGLILDIVPNHMGVGGRDNAWWLDTLEWGDESPFAAYFDINWDAVREDLKGRVLLPVLGDQYGVTLEGGDIELRLDRAAGSFSAWYYDHRFPISPHSYAAILDAGGGPLAGLAREFTAIRSCTPAAARERATALNPGLPLLRSSRRRLPRSRRRCMPSMVSLGDQRASVACTGCSTPRPIAWPIGGSPRRKSIIGASSTSTTWPACAWSCRSCSRKPIGWSSP
jgi:(1->4)-alpha-D-glucan 1-alpha-D-glucosylmutase